MSTRSNPMQYRSERLNSFTTGVKVKGSSQYKEWINDKPDVPILVDNGFYFTPSTKHRDEVTCVCCGKKEHNINEVDDIVEYHLLNFPDCPLSTINSSFVRYLQAEDKESYWSSLSEKAISDPLSKESVDLRKKTFKNFWKFDRLKTASSVTSKSLAKAGFYYSPLELENDRVLCMYCNCSLDHWEKDDDPVVEHSKNSTDYCYFLEMFFKSIEKNAPKKRSQRIERTAKKKANEKELSDHDIEEDLQKSVEINGDAGEDNHNGAELIEIEDTLASVQELSINDTSEVGNGDIKKGRKKTAKNSVKEIETAEANEPKPRRGRSALKIETPKSPSVSRTRGSKTSMKEESLPEPKRGRRKSTLKEKTPAKSPTPKKRGPKPRKEPDNVDIPRRGRLRKATASSAEPEEKKKPVNGDTKQDSTRRTRSSNRSTEKDSLIVLENEHTETLGEIKSNSKEEESSQTLRRSRRLPKTPETQTPDPESLPKGNRRTVARKTSNDSDREQSQVANSRTNDSWNMTTEADSNSSRKRKSNSNTREDSSYDLDKETSESPSDDSVSAESTNSYSEQAKNKPSKKKPATLIPSKSKKQKLSHISKSDLFEILNDDMNIDHFDGSRMDEILNSPSKKKKKKIRIINSAKSPSPNFFDLSHQNIGDYDEEHVEFHENDVQSKSSITNLPKKRRSPVEEDQVNVKRGPAARTKAPKTGKDNILDALSDEELFGEPSVILKRPRGRPPKKQKVEKTKLNVEQKISQLPEGNQEELEITGEREVEQNGDDKNNVELEITGERELEQVVIDESEKEQELLEASEIEVIEPEIESTPIESDKEEEFINETHKEQDQLNSLAESEQEGSPDLNKHEIQEEALEQEDAPLEQEEALEQEEVPFDENAPSSREELPDIFVDASHGFLSPIPSMLPSNISVSTDIDTAITFSHQKTTVTENNADNSRKEQLDPQISGNYRKSIIAGSLGSSPIYAEYVQDISDFDRGHTSSPTHNNGGKAAKEKLQEQPVDTVENRNESEEPEPEKNTSNEKQEMEQEHAIENNKKEDDKVVEDTQIPSFTPNPTVEPQSDANIPDSPVADVPSSPMEQSTPKSTSEPLDQGSEAKEMELDSNEAPITSEPEPTSKKSSDNEANDVIPVSNGTLTKPIEKEVAEPKVEEVGEPKEEEVAESKAEEAAPSKPHSLLVSLVEKQHRAIKLFEEELITLNDSIDYLKQLPTADYGLYNDIEGVITDFIAAMPEEEENMTIEEWIRHNAASCANNVKEISQKMVSSYEEICDEIIDTINNLPEV